MGHKATDFTKLDDWLDSGEYLPEELRDFHDQKELFKVMHFLYKESESASIAPNWRCGNIYAVDWLLWFMASRGLTLQKSRKKIPFRHFLTLKEAQSQFHTEERPRNKNRQDIYIFDLDGTVALIDHRRDILDDTSADKWRRFYALCDKDTPNKPVINVLESLKESGARILFFSGRSDEVKDKTVRWLSEHTSFTPEELAQDGTLTMRKLGDFTPDDQLKEQWLHSMLVVDRNAIKGVFDDRRKVVDMWRRNDLLCFQVADGNF